MSYVHTHGNLGSKPETKDVGNTTVTKFSLASNKVKKGEKVTTWYRVNVWGKSGEAAARYLDKGRSVIVRGDLEARPWVDDGGNARAGLEIENASWDFAGPKPTTNDNGYGEPSDGDDIPF